MPAQLEVDGLLLVAHPLVGPNRLESGEDEPWVHDQRGHLCGHLRHHRERQNRQPQQRRIERRDLAAAQCVVLRDRIVVGVEHEPRLDLLARDKPANLAGPGPWLRHGVGSAVDDSETPLESARKGSIGCRATEIGRHDRLLGLQERLHRVLKQ